MQTSNGQTTRPSDSKKQKNKNKKVKKTYRKVDFAVLEVHRVKIKESNKKDKYLDLAGEQKA